MKFESFSIEYQLSRRPVPHTHKKKTNTVFHEWSQLIGTELYLLCYILHHNIAEIFISYVILRGCITIFVNVMNNECK